MNEPNWLGYVTAFGALATPILVAFLGIVGWRFRSEYERRMELEDQLRGDRIQIYNTILEPFIIMFTPDEGWASDPKNKHRDKFKVGTQKVLSLDYRRFSFRLALLG
ncbi:MAG TPA: hypothetical protein VFK45_00085, partial [Gammaproteobacteria bacterium]|nr:hypothetical protein [Gammaproteobacteria bacterium]